MTIRKAFDARITNWSNTRRGGPKITIDLFDAIDLEEIIPLLDLEIHVVVQLADETDKVEVEQKKLKPLKITKDKKGNLRKLSQEAHLMCQEKNFWKFLEKFYWELDPGSLVVLSFVEADESLKKILAISSKSELDDSERLYPAERFIAMRNRYRDWVNGGMK